MTFDVAVARIGGAEVAIAAMWRVFWVACALAVGMIGWLAWAVAGHGRRWGTTQIR